MRRLAEAIIDLETARAECAELRAHRHASPGVPSTPTPTLLAAASLKDAGIPSISAGASGSWAWLASSLGLEGGAAAMAESPLALGVTGLGGLILGGLLAGAMRRR